MEPKIDQQSIIFQVGVPEGLRGRFWKDFGPSLDLFWDDFSKVFGRISMLGLVVFQVLASSFWLRWWEISLCCFHPFGYDLGVWSCAFCVMIFHMLILVLIKCSLLRFGGGGGRYRCVAATLLNII